MRREVRARRRRPRRKIESARGPGSCARAWRTASPSTATGRSSSATRRVVACRRAAARHEHGRERRAQPRVEARPGAPARVGRAACSRPTSGRWRPAVAARGRAVGRQLASWFIDPRGARPAARALDLAKVAGADGAAFKTSRPPPAAVLQRARRDAARRRDGGRRRAAQQPLFFGPTTTSASATTGASARAAARPTPWSPWRGRARAPTSRALPRRAPAGEPTRSIASTPGAHARAVIGAAGARAACGEEARGRPRGRPRRAAGGRRRRPALPARAAQTTTRRSGPAPRTPRARRRPAALDRLWPPRARVDALSEGTRCLPRARRCLAAGPPRGTAPENPGRRDVPVAAAASGRRTEVRGELAPRDVLDPPSSRGRPRPGAGEVEDARGRTRTSDRMRS